MKLRPRPNTQLVRTTSAEGQRASTRRSPSSLLRPYSERGRGRIVLAVGAAAVPGEDVVGRDVDQPEAARLADLAPARSGPSAFARRGGRGLALAAVDVGQGGGVHDDAAARARPSSEARERRRVRDVELRADRRPPRSRSPVAAQLRGRARARAARGSR